MKGQSFILGTLILAFSNLLVKIMGSLFRIPLGNLIKSEGLGYYQTVYPLFVFIMAISTSGMPVAISKMVAERIKLKKHKTAHKIFRVSQVILLFTGFLSFALFYFQTDLITKFLNDKNTYYTVKALAPALLIIPLINSYKGYFQGMSDMKPTSISQFFDQLARVISGLLLAYILLPKGLKIAAAGAAGGASIGAFVSLIIIILIYLKSKPSIKEDLENSIDDDIESTSSIIKELMLIAIPIIIGSLVIPMMNTIDAAMVKQRLIEHGGFSYKDANSLFGQYAGMAMTIVNLPQALTISIAMSIIPVISKSFIVKDYKKLKENIYLGTRLSNIIAMPFFFGILFLSTPIMKLLYPKEPDSIGSILFVMSFSIVLISLLQTYTAILQAIGKPMIPVINLFVASIFKISITYLITPIPKINVKGAAIGTVISYLIAMILDAHYIKKHLKMDFRLKDSFLKPAIMALTMGILAKITYILVFAILNRRAIATLSAILIGAIIYTFELLFMGGLSKSELSSIPGGNKLIKKIYKN